MGMLPRPDARALLTFHERSIDFPDIHQCDIPLVDFRRFVQQRKDTVRAGKAHDDGIDLIGDLVDVSSELFCHIEEGHNDADAEGKP